MNVFCPLEPSYRSALSSRVAFSALAKLKSVQGQPLASYIFLIEGSSVTSRGIDGEAIERYLRKEGISAMVIQLSLDGANHIEHYEILRQFCSQLTPDLWHRIRGSTVVLCHEVEAIYDYDPLNNIRQNFFTTREQRDRGHTRSVF